MPHALGRLDRATALDFAQDRQHEWRIELADREGANGGKHVALEAADVRELARLAKQAAKGTLAPEQAATLKVGSRLVRNWHGDTHQVLIRDDGFVYRDKLYRSLTPIAREITGSNWSGPRFFGLKVKGKAVGKARFHGHCGDPHQHPLRDLYANSDRSRPGIPT